jgi:hypothetical protein
VYKGYSRKINMNYLKKNLKVIKSINEDVAKNIEESKKPDWVTMIRSENKMDNFLISHINKQLPAYSLKDPLEGCEKYKKKDFLKENASFYIGAGMGHILYDILKKKEDKHHIVLVEPELWFIKKAFETYDLTKWIKDRTLIIISSSNKDDISALFGIFEQTIIIESWSLLTERYTMLKIDIYSEIVGFILQMINQIQCNVGTVMQAGAQIAQNDIANLPYVIRHRGVAELKDLYKNKPCVLVSTGPSLSKNIHLLKEKRENIIIIAVAQALRVLLAYDITPDFICTVDYGDVNEEHFKGLWDVDVPLVALNRSFAPILKKWQGPKFIGVSRVFGADGTIVGYLQDKGVLDQGGSVSHYCFGLATHLGCSPIIFTGQDLAFENDKSHIPLVDAGGRIETKDDGSIDWLIDDPRSLLQTEKGTGKKDNKNIHTMGSAIPIEGYFGDTVITNAGLRSFLTAFENLIRNYPDIKFINSTEGGAKITGAEQLTLKDTLTKYCRKPIGKKKIERLKKYCSGWKTEIKRAVEILKSDMEILDDVKKNAELGIEANEKIKTEKNKSVIKKLLEDNEKYSKAAHESAKKNNLVGLQIYGDSRKIYSRELNVKGNVKHLLKDKNDMATRLKRNKLILEAAIKASDDLKELYVKAKGILEEYIKTKNYELLKEKVEIRANLDDVDKYYDVDNWGHPYVDAKRVIDNQSKYDKETIEKAKKIYVKSTDLRVKAIKEANEIEDKSKVLEYNKLIEKAKSLGKDEKDFDTALKLLKRASKLCPNDMMARWGIATIYTELQQYEKAGKEYEKILKICPENYDKKDRCKFEYARIMISVDYSKGIEILKELMETTNEFDWFFGTLGNMYYSSKIYEEAIIAYEKYLELFPLNLDVMAKLKDCYDKDGDDKMADETQKKIDKILTGK